MKKPVHFLLRRTMTTKSTRRTTSARAPIVEGPTCVPVDCCGAAFWTGTEELVATVAELVVVGCVGFEDDAVVVYCVVDCTG